MLLLLLLFRFSLLPNYSLGGSVRMVKEEANYRAIISLRSWKLRPPCLNSWLNQCTSCRRPWGRCHNAHNFFVRQNIPNLFRRIRRSKGKKLILKWYFWSNFNKYNVDGWRGKDGLTPSVANTINSSFSVRRWYETSGTDITPKSLRQKSPKARAMARPGELTLGSQTRATCGSLWRANTLPLQSLILSASPEWKE